MPTNPARLGSNHPQHGHIDVKANELTHLARFIGETIDETRANVNIDSGFHATAQRLFWGELRMCRIRAEPHSVVARRSAPFAASQRGESLVVAVPLSGVVLVHNGQQATRLDSSHWWLHAANTPYRSEWHAPTDLVLVQLPWRLLSSALPVSASQHLVYRPLDSSRGCGQILKDLMLNCFSEAPALKAKSQWAVASAVVHTLRAALAEQGADVPSVPSSMLSYQRAVALIDQHLQDPLLEVGTLAHHMHCSRRYLHLVFQRHGHGRTVRAHITAQRLARCRGDLLAKLDVPISDIALRWGFQDAESFALAFRSAYGITPSTWTALRPADDVMR